MQGTLRWVSLYGIKRLEMVVVLMLILTLFIGGLIRDGRCEEACSYIEIMIDKGMKAPCFDYDKFLTGFSRVGRHDIF